MLIDGACAFCENLAVNPRFVILLLSGVAPVVCSPISEAHTHKYCPWVAGAALVAGGIVAGLMTPVGVQHMRTIYLDGPRNCTSTTSSPQPFQPTPAGLPCCGNMTALEELGYAQRAEYTATCTEVALSDLAKELYCYRVPLVAPPVKYTPRDARADHANYCPDIKGRKPLVLNVSYDPAVPGVVCETQKGSVALAITPTQLSVSQAIIDEVQLSLDQIQVAKGKKFVCNGVYERCRVDGCLDIPHYWYGTYAAGLDGTGIPSIIMLRDLRIVQRADLFRCCVTSVGLESDYSEDPITQAYRSCLVCGAVRPILEYELRGVLGKMSANRDRFITQCFGDGYDKHGEFVTTTTYTSTTSTITESTTTSSATNTDTSTTSTITESTTTSSATNTDTSTTSTITDTSTTFTNTQTTSTTNTHTTTYTITDTTSATHTTTTLPCCVSEDYHAIKAPLQRMIDGIIWTGSVTFTMSIENCISLGFSESPVVLEIFCMNHPEAFKAVWEMSKTIALKDSKSLNKVTFSPTWIVGDYCKQRESCLPESTPHVYRYSVTDKNVVDMLLDLNGASRPTREQAESTFITLGLPKVYNVANIAGVLSRIKAESGCACTA
jgi:hypothetical protein